MILSDFLLKNIKNKFSFMVLFTISWAEANALLNGLVR